VNNSAKAPKFNCTGCGKCCTGDPSTHYIELTNGEAESIRLFLGLGKARFAAQYLVSLEGNHKGIRINANRSCVFLDKKVGCLIYGVRPRQCRTYPFWPEILVSPSSWTKEARRCEGIGQGRLVPLKYRQNIT